MDWSDRAIVLGARKQGEDSLVLSVLTESQGRWHGLVRGGARSRQRGGYEPGALVDVAWHARLAEHLGYFRVEPLRNVTALLLDDPLRLACLEAACALVDLCLPEREPHPRSFAGLEALLASLGEDAGYADRHLHWEADLLAELGYGLDLATCAVTGAGEGLAYVSPRTGRAISAAAASTAEMANWRDRLLVLPRRLGGVGRVGEGPPSTGPAGELADLLDGLALTAHFLDREVLSPRGAALPPARARYVDRIARLMALSRQMNGSSSDD